MTMKVTLINPPQIYSEYEVGVVMTPPLGLAYLAAYLRQEGLAVELIDAVGEAPHTVTSYKPGIFLRGLTIEQIIERIPAATGLIGVSNLFTYAYPVVRELSAALRETFPGRPIVHGGAHPTAMYAEVLEQGAADYVILGEGELALTQLCSHVAGLRPIGEVPSLAYRDSGGKVMVNSMCGVIRNLDRPNMPFPARDLLPMQNYISSHEAHGATNGLWTPIISSRGCPYSCNFCQGRRKKWVARSARDVVDEIEECVNRWGITEFHFEDDNMTLDRRRTAELCYQIIRRGLKIKWQTPNGIRASVVDEALLAKMKAAGCTHITLAPESGSLRVVRDLMGKGKDYSHKKFLELAREAHQLGLKSAAYFILGMPGERPEDIEETISFAQMLARAGVDEAGFQLLIPLPGTPVWDTVVREYGAPDYLDLLVVGDFNRAKSWSKFLTEQQLASYRRRAYLSFQFYRAIFHPLCFMKTIVNVLQGRAETKIENYVRIFISRQRQSLITPATGSGLPDQDSASAKRSALGIVLQIAVGILARLGKKKPVKAGQGAGRSDKASYAKVAEYE